MTGRPSRAAWRHCRVYTATSTAATAVLCRPFLSAIFSPSGVCNPCEDGFASRPCARIYTPLVKWTESRHSYMSILSSTLTKFCTRVGLYHVCKCLPCHAILGPVARTCSTLNGYLQCRFPFSAIRGVNLCGLPHISVNFTSHRMRKGELDAF